MRSILNSRNLEVFSILLSWSVQLTLLVKDDLKASLIVVSFCVIPILYRISAMDIFMGDFHFHWHLYHPYLSSTFIKCIYRIREQWSKKTGSVTPRLDYGEILYEQAYNTSFHQKLKTIQYISCLAITEAIRYF